LQSVTLKIETSAAKDGQNSWWSKLDLLNGKLTAYRLLVHLVTNDGVIAF